MVRVLIWLGQLLLVAPALYSSFISLFGLRTPAEPSFVLPILRIRVLVSAHDEASVIEGLMQDLSAQSYPANLLSACVIADRCSDNTADIAGRYVEVAVRSEGVEGKGAAIAWHLERVPLESDEVLLVLDADSRVAVDYVQRVVAAFDAGAQVVQSYLDISNPDGSVLSTASALTYWSSNRMIQLARSNLGWSCDLGGTGMAFTSSALKAVGGFSSDLADDLSLNLRLNLAGYRAVWLHGAHVLDEKPVDTKSFVVQRSRWARGKRDAQRQYGTLLVRKAFVSRQPALLDLAFRLYHPGRSFVAGLLVLLAALAAVFPEWGFWPWPLLAAIAAGVVALPVVFLILDGVPGRYIWRYPLVAVIAILWLPIRIGSRVLKGWNPTPHGDQPSR